MSPTDITSHVHEAAIRQRVADWAAAISAKNLDAVVSLYAPDVVSFDLTPPLRYAGAEGKRRAWQTVLAALSGPIAYEVRDPERHDARRVGVRVQPQPHHHHRAYRSGR